jgi:PAS domain S-box-containing protein
MDNSLKLKDALNRSELLFSQLWDISVDGMRIIDGNGIIIMVNDAYCRMVEKTKEELVGNTFSIVYDSSEQKNVLKTYQRDAINDEIKTRFERENTLWNGKKIWFEFANSFLNIPDSGKITLSIIKDITERKGFELELVESEKKFRMLFDNANDAVFVTQLTEDKTYGDFIEVNDVTCRRLGYTKEEFLRLSPSAIISPKFINEFNRSIEILLNDNHIIYEVIHRAKDRKLIPTEISSHLFKFENKLTVLSIARDITERKQSEEKLKRTTTVLRNLAYHLQTIREEERSLIAREIHDELGQTLTVLKIQISLLAKKLRDDQQELKEKFESVSKTIDETVEKVQSISSRLRPGILDELGLIPAIEWQSQEFEKLTGVHCSLSFPQYELELENEKATAVFRIFQEALTNIIRHASATIVSVNMHIESRLFTLEIKDNGVGITASQIKDTKSLGLIGMNERAMIFGGEVSIEGIPDKGTKVKVQIPL